MTFIKCHIMSRFPKLDFVKDVATWIKIMWNYMEIMNNLFLLCE